jgi:hypothetical protein
MAPMQHASKTRMKGELQMTRFRSAVLGLVLMACSAAPVFPATFEGSSSGIFTDPVGPAGMVTGGVGTSDFRYGSIGYGTPSNRLTFTGVGAISAEPDALFSFGSLYYYNGTTAMGSTPDSVKLDVSINLTSPFSTSENFLFPFRLISTVNTSDPNASADSVKFVAVASPASFSYNGIDYTLQFLGFGNIVGGGFAGIDEFHVLENRSATANLIGRFTAKGNVTPVPEPGSLVLLGTGLAGLAGFRVRRSRRGWRGGDFRPRTDLF